MMIETIIALVGLALLAIFVIVSWADSVYQSERYHQRRMTRKHQLVDDENARRAYLDTLNA